MSAYGTKRTYRRLYPFVRFAPECVAKLSLRPWASRDSVGLRGDSRERSMMGRREGGQGQFFYAFDLGKVVPPDHLSRQIDSVIDVSCGRKELASYYSDTGRPASDPVLMIRMLIVGYVFAIRSERRICAEVQVNLAYRWFCKLGIEDRIPNHSVFCRARHERFRESDALRRVFEGVVATCIAAGLVGGEAFSIDASLIKADVDKKKRLSGDQPIAWPKSEEASHAVWEYLAALDAARSEDESDRSGDGSGSNSDERGGKPPKQVSLTDPQAAWVTRKGIDPFFDKSARHDGIFSRADFVFDQERNVYMCPGGAELTSTGNIDQGHIVYYRANKHDCSACSLKPRCTTAAMRKVTRDVDEEVRDRVHALANTEAFQQS